MRFARVFLTACLCLGIAAATASAGLTASYYATGVAGNQAPPPYGLRLDGFYTGNASDEVTFSFDDVRFDFYDDGSAHLFGLISVAEFNNSGTDGGYTHSYNLNVWFNEITDATALGNIQSYNSAWKYYDLNPTGVELTSVSDPTQDFSHLWSYPTDGSKPFRVGDGANGKNGNFGAAGWLTYEHEYFGDKFGSQGQYAQSSDFLMDLQAVPEPGTMILFGLGLAGAGVYRRVKDKVK